MLLKLFQGISVILTSLLEAFLRNKEVQELRNEKLESKDEAIKFKAKEAEIMSASARSRLDILERMHPRSKKNSDNNS